MKEAFELKIVAIFATFSASIAGFVLPLALGRKMDPVAMMEHAGFSMLRSFSAGIMLGVAFIHILAEAADELPYLYPDYPALPYTLATVGIIFTVTLENIAMAFLKQPNAPKSEHEHSRDSVNLAAESKDFFILVKAYSMEIAIAVHSVVIGISLGAEADDSLQTIKALTIALSLHQFFEGVGLGVVVAHVRHKLGIAKIILFSLIFGVTLSIGIIIGISIQSSTTTVQAYYSEENGQQVEEEHEAEEHVNTQQARTTGCLNAIAAGTLVYISLI
eukprot:gene11674-24451_t